MRTVVSLLMLAVGITLAVVSYFFLAAPLGQATSSVYSNPRLLGAPTIFVLGVVLIFLSAVVYELLPTKQASKAVQPSEVEQAPIGRAAEPALGASGTTRQASGL